MTNITSLEAAKEALGNILCMHDGNQSPAMNMPELDYARRVIRSIHNETKEALELLNAHIAKMDSKELVVETWLEVCKGRSDWRRYPTPYPCSEIKDARGEESHFVVLRRDGGIMNYIRWGIPKKEECDEGANWEPMVFIEFATYEEAEAAIKTIKGS